MNKLPNKSKLIQKELRATDNRGEIISIIDAEIFNVSIITCENKSIRSNHYHKKDHHFMYVLSGSIDYFYKPVSNSNVEYLEVSEGQTIFTPNMEWHATFFPTNTDLIVCSLNPRDRKTYEEDTIRELLITEENIGEYLERYKSIS